MATNPCLTILLVYSALVTISLISTSALLATNHTSVVCSGEGGDGEVVVTHYSVVDNSHDEVEEGEPGEICQCHCDCKKEELITAVEVFILTSVGILVLAVTIYSCLGMRYIILNRGKINAERIKLETEKIEAEK